jgi:branched-chain amino acid transport system substrate-binding protein
MKLMWVRCLLFSGLAVGLFGMQALAQSTKSVPVGQLAAETGPTSDVGAIYAEGIGDAIRYIDDHGGIDGEPISLEVKDYGYDSARAEATYDKWLTTLKPVAIQGWGTADTIALIDKVAHDEIVYMSGSSAGELTDPTGRSPHTNIAAPYNFFYGPSYSDGCRGLVQWAAENWKRTGGSERSTFLEALYRPKFVYMGDNHPYPNAPKAACTEYARELGFEILPPIRYSLTPGDFSQQCHQLRQMGAQYAFLANTSESNIALLQACAREGVSTQFMTNIYGWDEKAAETAGDAGNGLVWVVSAARWGEKVPGMALVEDIARTSGHSAGSPLSVHYIRGVCSAYFMRDAMAAAAKERGGITGPNIKKGFEQMRDHVPEGLEGVCLPSTWTENDHRGTTTVMVYRSNYDYGNATAKKIFTTQLPLRPDWLGW